MWPDEWSEFLSWHPSIFINWPHIAHPVFPSSSFPWKHQAGEFILLFLISTSTASDYSTLPPTGLDFLLTLPAAIQVSSAVEVHPIHSFLVIPQSPCPSLELHQSVQFSCSVVSDSLWPPWIAARQASLFTTNSSTSIESVMPSSHLILCRPLLLLPPIPPGNRVFSNESTLRMRWPKYWRDA